MSILQKIINYKNTIRYHKFMVSKSFWQEIIKLYFVKFFLNKNINIIILPEHIGDVIAFVPFAEYLKTQDKNTYIVWLIQPKYLSIIEQNNHINYCITTYCDGFSEKFSVSKLFKTYDVRFNGNNFCSICNTERKYQKIDLKFNLENYYEYGSLLEIFSKLAKQPLKKEDWFPQLNVPENVKTKITKRNLPEKYICIHTTSNDVNREWLYEKWEELIFLIIKKCNIKIVQIGLENKLNINDSNFIDLCGELSLIETAEVINRSKIFIGIDSGPAHIANALKVKSIILLGKYREVTNYMPFSGNFANGINSNIIYNSKTKCSEIEIEKVFNLINIV